MGNECRTRRCSEREPADSLRDESNVIGGWLPSLTFALDTHGSIYEISTQLCFMITKTKEDAFFTVAILLGIIFLMGCKPKNDTAQRGQVIRNTQLQTDLDRAVGLPLERDPAKRPLILSQPPPNKQQWA